MQLTKSSPKQGATHLPEDGVGIPQLEQRIHQQQKVEEQLRQGGTWAGAPKDMSPDPLLAQRQRTLAVKAIILKSAEVTKR